MKNLLDNDQIVVILDMASITEQSYDNMRHGPLSGIIDSAVAKAYPAFFDCMADHLAEHSGAMAQIAKDTAECMRDIIAEVEPPEDQLCLFAK